MTGEKTFDVSLAGMSDCQAFLESICPSPKPQIILDEIVSNIVRCSGATFFRIGYAKEDESLREMTFPDDGVAFDPTTESKAPDVTAALEDRAVGGLGIFMVKKMSKAVVYRREGNLNILTVTL